MIELRCAYLKRLAVLVFIGVIAVLFYALYCASKPCHATTVKGSAQVEIRSPIAISETNGLDFGVVDIQTQDVLTLSTAGSVSSQNNPASNITNSGAGHFIASGSPNTSVSISFSDSSLSGPGASMLINNFTHNAGSNPSFDSSGQLAFNVGADLQINNEQKVGFYSGNYNMTIDYQ